jgi:hypothetical protein
MSRKTIVIKKVTWNGKKITDTELSVLEGGDIHITNGTLHKIVIYFGNVSD